MKTDLFDYELPRELIAAHPPARREDARLLVVDRATGGLSHRAITDLTTLLRPTDLLVVNDSRVMPARLHVRRVTTGALVELLLLERLRPTDTVAWADTDTWRVMARPARKLKVGEDIELPAGGPRGRVLGEPTASERDIAFATADILPWLEKLGEIPLPPYIVQRRRETESNEAHAIRFDTAEDRERYQTVYAAAPGSVAAPTAGLHFSNELLAKLEAMGVQRAAVTLHVGAGTFKPVETEDVSDHVMHSERFVISPETAAMVNAARAAGRRVVAVGTTAVRSLESAADDQGVVIFGEYETRLMITPGYSFKAVDALLTNFHLPKSTLLMLVSAFAGREHVLAAYHEAVKEKYRFFSYGDAMLIG